ncbi:MAG TPA: hypothetical protein VLV85_16155 [Stellaceae bacterium]|nr:hypothetical protein [Stellaceae bacterium]
MMAAVATQGPERCRNLLCLAAFEIASGFFGTAREHIVNAAHCSATGRCASPRLCRAAEAAASPTAEPAVVSLPAPRTGVALPLKNGAAEVLALTPPTAHAADSAGNRVERRPLSLGRLQSSRRLSLLLEYWRELWMQSHGAMIDFDPVRLVQISALGWVHLIDVSDADPARFAVPIRGWRVPNAAIGESREGMQLSEHPVRILAEGVMADYAAARDNETPLYHAIHSQLRGHRYAYRRLILPLSSDGKRTDRLLVATDFG